MSRRWYLKIFSAFLLVILAAVVPSALWLGSHLQALLMHQKQQELRQELNLAANLIGRDIGEAKGDKKTIQPLVLRIGRDTQKRATVIAPDGKVLGDSHVAFEAIEQLENHADRPEIIEAKTNGYGQSVRFSTTLQDKALYGAVPLMDEGRLVGYLRLAMPLRQVEDTITALRKNLFLGASLSFFLALFFGFVLTWTVNRPLREISAMMRQMSEGNLKQPYHLLPRKELKELSASLEKMGRELDEKIELLDLETTQLNAMLSAMGEGVLVTDEKGRAILVNPFLKQVLGGTASWKRKTVQEIFMNSELQDAVEAILKGESFRKVNLVYGRTSPRYFEVQIVPLTPPRRNRRAVALFHETTELQHLLKVRQDFVANASHELRTPLTSISGYVETLQSIAPDTPPEIRRFLSIIQKNVRQMNSIIVDLLELARLDGRETDLERREHVSVIEVLAAAGQMIKDAARQKGITYQEDWGTVPPETKAFWERDRIVQAVFNLLDNAVKYTPEGGEVRFKAEIVQRPEFSVQGKDASDPSGRQNDEGHSDFLEIRVEDTGIGIPKEHLPRIFERFYRVDKARSREVGGTGLGLAIVKHIVESHGGRLQVQSTVGKGSVFTLLIPLTPPSPSLG